MIRRPVSPRLIRLETCSKALRTPLWTSPISARASGSIYPTASSKGLSPRRRNCRSVNAVAPPDADSRAYVPPARHHPPLVRKLTICVESPVNPQRLGTGRERSTDALYQIGCHGYRGDV